MKVVAILQARCSSSRLPNKVLKPILGVPMILRQIERLQRCHNLQQLVVATSSEANDDALEMLCAKADLACYRGSLEDVLDRFYNAAKFHNATHIVRLTADCPLIDPDIVDGVIDCFFSESFDYVSNTLTPTYPDGLDVEVFSFEALESAWKQARLPSEREHVTPYLYNHPELFRTMNFAAEKDLSALRWTVDNPEDFVCITKIYESLYPANAAFKTQDILEFLSKHPEFISINSHLERNEGMKKSMLEDGVYIKKTILDQS